MKDQQIDRQPTERRIVTTPETSRAWWFLGTLSVLRNPPDAPHTPAVIEMTIPAGGSPPRHIHDNLDDSFLLLDGEMVVRCGERTFLAQAGSYVSLPAGVEHTFRVTSAGPARLLLVHADDSFVRFIEAAGTPTQERRLPPPDAEHFDREALIRVAAEHDVRILGAPLDEAEVRAWLGADAPHRGLH